MSLQPLARPLERALEVAPSSRGRASRCRPARSRRPPAAPTRCSAGRRAASSGRRSRQIAGQHALAAAHARVGSACARTAARYRPGDGEEGPPRQGAAETEYRDEHGNVLALRGALTPATRPQYAEVAGGNILSREDAWQRSVEFLFERLAVRWEIAGTEPITKQKELLARFRFASAGGAPVDPRDAAQAPRRAVPGDGGTVNVDGFARLLTDYCLEVQPGPAGRWCARPRSPRRCCWRCSGRSSSARRGRCCAPRCPGRTRASGAPCGRAPRRLPVRRARRGARDRRLAADHRHRERERARRRRPGADGPRRPRPRRAARAACCSAAGRSRCGRRPPPPSRRGWARGVRPTS